ncbi:MAG: pantoate--beta-alanine ligase [Candidatus Dactylopiibacterium carminicum]|uniref:Pantothenate synthetase n=1 Tax=Candidatus Dactylopiibacterium carminicum TaxID=857335 RepID=A0A272EMU7_9RHOO|nr:pantoate--beta-alanine ligase [Candidatus Dactylopiibacterium carminicum]KAF7597859.1 pantoate--beta-alanine ligase [Candidatus Dactylopiibacterium carminicum]PAS91448.1 MAG: pantoate--beta-alanine ligase [Candidatus Dactylopiibacterium carminicum]PAS95755.1 MAG: pantoate--beta-alanine ligase [Candidatus Dactylopiibacterium carminicum]
MQIHTRIASLRAALASAGRIGFAPTMGNLHAGHVSLMRTARQHADSVVSSIFVNRLQFGPNEDFDRYPRTFKADCEKLEAAGVDHLFAPDEATLYPQTQTYLVTPDPMHDGLLEGAIRPGHFAGVTTVVSKLFNIVQPQVACFGKKDYQQLMVIRNMVAQLNLPIEVIGCEIVRADDGLALSSRNGYLSAEERTQAPQLQACLQQVVSAIVTGDRNRETLETQARDVLIRQGWAPDYITIRRQADLQAPEPGDAVVILAAARLGKTRLIDNLECPALW